MDTDLVQHISHSFLSLFPNYRPVLLLLGHLRPEYKAQKAAAQNTNRKLQMPCGTHTRSFGSRTMIIKRVRLRHVPAH